MGVGRVTDDITKAKFTRLKLDLVAAILADSELSSSAARFATAVLLKWFFKEHDECFASYDTIAEVAGMKRRATAIKAAQELEEAKWLKIEKRGRGKGGRSNTNRFIFNFDRIRNGTESVLLEGINGTLFVQNGTESAPDPFLIPSLPSRGEKRDKYEGAYTASASAGAEPSRMAQEGFAEFWQVYPKRVGIEAARREFIRIVEDGTATPEAIIQGARQYAASNPGKFTKQPAKWLQDGHYADEPQTKDTRPKSRTPRQPAKKPSEVALRYGFPTHSEDYQ
jgi:hypothetical protein